MYINELKTSLIRHIKHFNNEFFVVNFFHIMYAPLSSLCDVNIIPCFSTIMELSRSISTIMEILHGLNKYISFCDMLFIYNLTYTGLICGSLKRLQSSQAGTTWGTFSRFRCCLAYSFRFRFSPPTASMYNFSLYAFPIVKLSFYTSFPEGIVKFSFLLQKAK